MPIPPQRDTGDSRLAPAPLSRYDGLLLILCVAMFFFITWFRRHGILWNDEIMGWTTLDQPTWHDVIRVWWSGVDSSGFFFYVFARPWLQLFGWTELSLHLWTTTFMSASFVLAWVVARRFASLSIVAIVAPLVFLGNRVVVQQFNNGRTYGILLLSAALVCYVLLRTDPEDDDANSTTMKLLSFVGFLVLVGSQTLGMMFWGMFLAAFVLRDLIFRRAQWAVYLGALIALVAIVPLSWRNIQADLDMGKPTFWTPKPTVKDFFMGFGDLSGPIAALLVSALALFLFLYFRQPAETRGPLVPRNRISLYCLLAVFPALTVLMFALSLLGKSIFIDRYLLPVSLGDILILSELFMRIRALAPAMRPVRLALVGVGAFVVLALFGFDLRRQGLPGRDYITPMLAALPQGKPIVITDTSVFIDTIHYKNDKALLLTPTDWSIQLDPDFGGGGASFLHEMEDWKKMGIYADHILSTQELLAKYPSFVVITDTRHTLWVRRYLLDNPDYNVQQLPDVHGEHVWNVERR